MQGQMRLSSLKSRATTTWSSYRITSCEILGELDDYNATAYNVRVKVERTLFWGFVSFYVIDVMSQCKVYSAPYLLYYVGWPTANLPAVCRYDIHRYVEKYLDRDGGFLTVYNNYLNRNNPIVIDHCMLDKD